MPDIHNLLPYILHQAPRITSTPTRAPLSVAKFEADNLDADIDIASGYTTPQNRDKLAKRLHTTPEGQWKFWFSVSILSFWLFDFSFCFVSVLHFGCCEWIFISPFCNFIDLFMILQFYSPYVFGNFIHHFNKSFQNIISSFCDFLHRFLISLCLPI